jgi:hypothetical protein
MAKKQNGKTSKRAVRRNRRPAGMRSNATSVLAQGVGAVPKQAFGAVNAASLAVWDAKLLHHLPLPRAVGPYLVVRTTKRFSVDAHSVIFGTFKTPAAETGDYTGDWSNVCAMYDVNGALPIGDPNNAVDVVTPLTFLTSGTSMATCVPSAFTVQILNPEALQTTTGVIYAGVMNTQARVGGRTESWDNLMNRFVQYQSPRLLSAAKLALRGVQISSYPLSMTPISEFTTMRPMDDGITTFGPRHPEPTGWAPIMVYNPQGVALEYLVTTEWRVRFDLANPASAAHVHHPIATDGLWNNLCRQASALGHGVRDISEVVANGAQAYQAARTAMSALRALPMA